MTAPGVSRRQLLVGGAALSLVTACSSDDGGGDDASPSSTTVAGGANTLLVLLPQQGVLTTNGEQRVPVAVAADGVPVREDLPPRQFQIRTDAGDPVVVDVDPHADGIPTPYYPVRFTPEAAGIHEITVVGEDGFNPITFDITDTTEIPSIGDALPALDTPTTGNARGVTPICTRDPACELHDVTLREVLSTGSPVALLVATPEFCQVAICGPVLDLLVEALPDFPTVKGLHVEVYADPRSSADPTAAGLAPTTEALHLPFEPTLYLADASGTIVNRLDSVFDRVELQDGLAQIA
jgi:hypothetical protein